MRHPITLQGYKRRLRDSNPPYGSQSPMCSHYTKAHGLTDGNWTRTLRSHNPAHCQLCYSQHKTGATGLEPVTFWVRVRRTTNCAIPLWNRYAWIRTRDILHIRQTLWPTELRTDKETSMGLEPTHAELQSAALPVMLQGHKHGRRDSNPQKFARFGVWCCTNWATPAYPAAYAAVSITSKSSSDTSNTFPNTTRLSIDGSVFPESQLYIACG